MKNPTPDSKPIFITTAGVIGGFGAWVWAITIGPGPAFSNPYLGILAYMFLGGIAGFLGVYLVAKTDPAQTAHAIAFSLACGVFWGPVISGVEAMVNKSNVERIAATNTRDAAVLHEARRELEGKIAEVKKDMQSAAEAASQIETARRELLSKSANLEPQLGSELVDQIRMIDSQGFERRLLSNSADMARISEDINSVRIPKIDFSPDEAAPVQ